ncbi:MAG TPA: glycosyl hydrolase family 18 protein, partial [Chitinophagales bacterium]|nr:glycosyl hydrolase family 18 protein [Chitinophagales bacterium]
MVGYWHNWSDWSAPYIDLTDVDDRYNIINVSFATPQTGTDYQMEFAPDQVTQATLIAQIQTLQSQGKIVNISVGGANAIVALDNTTERDAFINTMTDIINTYGFDGMDIDLEGSSVSITGGTISTPVDAKIINLIEATKQIMLNFRV